MSAVILSILHLPGSCRCSTPFGTRATHSVPNLGAPLPRHPGRHISYKFHIFTRGYSLIELLVTLSIIACITTAATPLWQNLLHHRRQEVTINHLITALNLARNTAIAKGIPVTICKSDDHQHCGGKWSDGQIAFFDPNALGNIEKTDQLIAVFPGVPVGTILEFKASRTSDFLQFDVDGTTRGQAAHFFYKDGEKIEEIIVSITGRIRVEMHPLT